MSFYYEKIEKFHAELLIIYLFNVIYSDLNSVTRSVPLVRISIMNE